VFVEDWCWHDWNFEGKHYHELWRTGDPELRVTVHVDDMVAHYRGKLEYSEDGPGEVDAKAVTFKPGTPQAVVDRVGRTFAAMAGDYDVHGIYGPDLDRVLALLDGLPRLRDLRPATAR
jgi:hypothetical protein